MWYKVNVWVNGETDTVYISEEFYTEEKLDRGTNLESYIIDCLYDGQLVNVGYPFLVDSKEQV